MPATKELLHYAKQGTGPSTIVFLHGMVGSHRYWDEITTRLLETHTTIALDLLGFGDSPKPQDAAYSLEDHIESIHLTLEGMGVTPPFILVGHSMGALVALQYALDHPHNVKRLVLCSIPLFANAKEAKYQLKHANIVPNLMVEGPIARTLCAFMCAFRPTVQKVIPAYYKYLPEAVAIDSTKHTWWSYSRSLKEIIIRGNVVEDIIKLQMPTVLLIGGDDVLPNELQLTKLHSPINVRVVESATHHLPLEQPDTVIEELLQ